MRRVPTDPSSNEPEEDPSSRRQARRQGIVYQGASEAVLAIPISIGLGYGVDSYFDTSPLFLFVGAALGFAAFVVRLFRLGRHVDAVGKQTDDPDSTP